MATACRLLLLATAAALAAVGDAQPLAQPQEHARPQTSAASEPPPFTATVSRVTAAELGRSYRRGCPVGPAGLRRIDLRSWGFDGTWHTGSIVAATAVTPALVAVFRRLYAVRFPLRRVEPVAASGG